MSDKMDRRTLMSGAGAAVGVAALGLAGCERRDESGKRPDSAEKVSKKEMSINEARPGEPSLYRSKLDAKDIERDKLLAIQNLKQGVIDNDEKDSDTGKWKLRHIREKIFPVLANESQMDIPSDDDYRRLNIEKYSEDFRDMTAHIKPNRYGFFVDGDTKSVFVMQKVGDNQFRFIKRYKLLPSKHGWSNAFGSKGTARGLHGIARVDEGLLGEEVSQAKEHADSFLPIRLGKKLRRFARGVREADGDPYPAMITRAYLLVSLKGARKSPNTTSARGMNMHGRNRLEDLILGINGSSGCLGMANVDIEDIKQYIDVGKPIIVKKRGEDGQMYEEYVEVEGGTPVMIHATRNIQRESPMRQEPREAPAKVPPSPPAASPSRGPNWSPFNNNQGPN